MDKIEQEILDGIKARNQKAFGYLVRLYFQPLLLFGQTITHDPELSREIIQDVFLKIWNSNDTLHITTSLKSYLYRMVHNRSLDYLREKNQKKKIKISSYDDLSMRQKVFTIEDPQSFFDLVFSEQTEKELQKAIGDLPGQCREIFLLCRYEQMTYAEIAAKLNLSPSTVKTQMVRAIMKLKEAMKDFL
jgi:RNA polymerase sigma-70 factor, ECF subfamily